ncbi:MAG: DUF4160 domain-containing protein [Acidobacteria bacterium]|nr:DUF4160 domain-containing protein [Acidobacteriota bacterium]MCZ6769250.1 DUF4160 domain-containing protein [Acidobacteriota bacterium]
MSPTVKRIGSYRFLFFSNEGFEPPHIHVQEAHKPAQFWLGHVRLASSTGFAAHELTHLRNLVEESKTEFLECWNEYFGS